MKPLWEPTRQQIDRTHLGRFLKEVNKHFGTSFTHYDPLYDWSVRHIPEFWDFFWDFSGLIASKKGDKILSEGASMEKVRFFPGATLNYAENLLKNRPLETQAIVFWGEDNVKRSLTFKALKDQVSALQSSFARWGIAKGDRVAGFMPNMPETFAAMLATTSLGAVWTSCSPDFGSQGILDRFGQTKPKVLFTADGYFYAGHWHSSLEKVRQIRKHLAPSLKIVVVPYGADFREKLNTDEIPYSEILDISHPASPSFVQVSFNDPLFILYSSGTTGVPKCIVHGHGGTLIQHLKEHLLHCDIHPADRVFYFTTCGWMMWNWLASALASQATLMLFDGAPFYPKPDFLFDYAQDEKLTFFGTSAKFIERLRKQDIQPKKTHDLSSLRFIASTGSPLSAEGFDYVYQSIASDVCLASISGGTDIISCFALGNPIGSVWRGELQARGLGLKVEVFNEQGQAVAHQKGELDDAPFPSMPLGFWKDASEKKYHDAYFSRFPNVWCHGDYVELTEHQGLIIYGRSDSVLNPGGVRIGTAEIYRQVEHIKEIVECIAVGQEVQGDSRIILFVHLKEGMTLTATLEEKIKHQIREATTPRHVPALILEVPDIPRTLSGKLVERAVTEIIHGRPITNKESLANPEALEFYKDLKELTF